MALQRQQLQLCLAWNVKWKDDCNETMRTWAGRCKDTFYVLGSTVDPPPYPMFIRDFQKIISEEIKQQGMTKEAKLPDYVIACVGGASNATVLSLISYKTSKYS